MSLDLLRERDARHEFRHDVESAVLWVLTYAALRYLPHVYPNMKTIRKVYPPIEPSTAQIICITGDITENHYLLFNPTTRIELESAPLDDLLKKIFAVFRKYYGLLPMVAGSCDSEEQERLAQEIRTIRGNTNNPDYFIDIFDSYTSETVTWPVNDKCDDRFPPTEKEAQDLERFTNTFNTRNHLCANYSSRVVAPPVLPSSPPVDLPTFSTEIATCDETKPKAQQSTTTMPSSPIPGPSSSVERKTSSSSNSGAYHQTKKRRTTRGW